MKKLSFVALTVCAVVIVFAACGDKKFKGYQKTSTEWYYKFIEKNPEGRQPQIGDVLSMTMSYHSDNDSIHSIFPKLENEEITVVLRESMYRGDIFEAFSMLREGEEAEFAIKADSFFSGGGAGEIPDFVKPEDVLFFKIKLDKVKTKEEAEQEMEVKRQEYEVMLEQWKEEEKIALPKYIAEQKITVKPTASGLYFIEKEKGKGAKAENGKEVTVHYTGKFLDGTVFDSSIERGEPIKIPLGVGMVIKGWEEGISLMKEGGKATLVIPSDLAYGERGRPGIPPCSSLVFEIELIKVADPKPAAEIHSDQQ